MKIVDQGYYIVERLDRKEALRLIESSGRTAYKSESALDEASGSKFSSLLIKRGHESVIEHAHMTVHFVTDRGVSHEIVRHRLASFTQESTRYCDYAGSDMAFVRPYNMDRATLDSLLGYVEAGAPIDQICDPESRAFWYWLNIMHTCELAYRGMLLNGMKPQDARAVLPNSLKTEIVVTANLREWRHIFKLRAIEKAAHPQMRDLMIPLYDNCRTWLPEIFDMGEPE